VGVSAAEDAAPDSGREPLRAPFPWFGGKRRVASVVWEAFGADVANYVEPFFGSGAVLLGRPGGPGKIETVNDADRFLANFWRAVAANPDAVAAHADWPVNEADMHARHKWLVNQTEFRERMHVDPEYFDVKIAGWWVWGLCMWIGGGWCVEPNNHKHPKLDGIGKGVHSQAGHPREKDGRLRTRPKMSADSAGMGVHSDAAFEPSRQLPHLAVTTTNGMAAGVGIHSSNHRKLFAGDTRRGVHSEGARSRGADRSEEANRPDLAGVGRGVHAQRGRRGSEADWRKRPELDGTAPGRGVHSEGDRAAYSPGRRPNLNGAAAGQGVHALGAHESTVPCVDWFRALQARLRRVRVACGDWQRVLGPSVLGKGKGVGGRRPCAVFLDPPYSFGVRDPYLYAEDDAAISAKVRDWAIAHGDDRDIRIALCGYEGEHAMPSSWRCFAWKAARGYSSASNTNRELERIWFSPHCLKDREANRQQQLFAVENAP
jgi:hypothetical protein